MICGYSSNFTSGIQARQQLIMMLADKKGEITLCTLLKSILSIETVRTNFEE
jgi:hypothetical protein